jgi:hypothetical protein
VTTPGDGTSDPSRPVVLHAVRGLIDEARSERSLLLEAARRQLP